MGAACPKEKHFGAFYCTSTVPFSRTQELSDLFEIDYLYGPVAILVRQSLGSLIERRAQRQI